MKKVALAMLFIVLTVGVIYNYSNNTEKEVSQITYLTNDMKKDYEDIVIKKGNENEKLIALTFDDGPDEDFSPQILDILKKYNAKATFFVVGQKVGWHPEIVKRAYEEGHEIGNHTFSHINVGKRSEYEILTEIEKTQTAIKDVIGKEPELFRPPYRAISRSMFEIIKSKNMKVVLWSDLDARDWSNPGVYNIVKTIQEKADSGSIVLLHDYNTVRNNKSQTIQALETIIPEMQKQGYKFVTVSEIISDIDKETKKDS
ncbi:MAG: polysaccharide deacetylase family protein [Paraclostridium sp.]